MNLNLNKYMNKAIQKAIEGGWKGHAQDEPVDMDMLFHELGNSMLLDPLFWQCLGKALGWDYECRLCGFGAIDHRYRHPFSPAKDMYIKHWHSLIDHIADGGTPDEYFQTIIK